MEFKAGDLSVDWDIPSIYLNENLLKNNDNYMRILSIHGSILNLSLFYSILFYSKIIMSHISSQIKRSNKK